MSTRKRCVYVIGGHTTEIEKFSFTAGIIVKNLPTLKGDVFAGGAAIVSSSWAITAAHCVSEFMTDYLPKGSLYVRSNTTNWKCPSTHYCSTKQVIKGFIHEKHDDITDDYDIAALKVKEEFTGAYERPVLNLAGTDYKYVTGTEATVLGWGTTEVTNEEDSDVVEAFTVSNLRAVEVNIIDQEVCVEAYRKLNETITPRMLCANARGKDACVNDSGGPLVQNATLIGLVSWGVGCAKEEFPGIYTRISTVQKWIEEIQAKN